MAVKGGYEQTVTVLLEKGADVNYLDQVSYRQTRCAPSFTILTRLNGELLRHMNEGDWGYLHLC
jgi:hypothetical protein